MSLATVDDRILLAAKIDASTIRRGFEMVFRCWIIGGFSLFVALGSGCRSPYYADHGAALGGVTGAALGAAVGENSDKPLAGALFGGALGLIAGNAIGQSIDDDIARNNAIIEQQMGRRLSGAARTEDVVAMTHAGLGDQTIATYIQSHGVARPPTPEDMIYLKQQGVSDLVINALQNQTSVERVQPRPIIIEEHHHLRPAYFGPPLRHFHHRHYHPQHRRGVHWGISISN